MFVRIEEIKDTDVVLVVSELNTYIGKMFYADFASCVDNSKEEVYEDDYLYWFVYKKLISKYLKV